MVCLSSVLEPLTCRLVQVDANAEGIKELATENMKSLNTENRKVAVVLKRTGPLERP